MKVCVLKKQKCIVYYLRFALLLLTVLVAGEIQAEGSRDLFPSGAQGYRAYLLSSTTDANFNPFATPGTVRVWVKPDETIYVGSSVIGKRWPSTTGTYPTIVLRSPDGQTYTLGGTSSTTGLIATREQEINGPNRTGVTNGYTPLTRVVQSGQGGIWEIDFIGLGTGTNIPAPTTGAQPTGTYFGNTYTSSYDGNYLANANWVQPLSYGSNVPVALIAAWDVSVGSASNSSTLISGRAFTTLFSGTAPNSRFNEPSFYSKFYVLTPEGNSYLVDNNGQNGASFNFFSNNKGAVTSLNNGQPTYQSINSSQLTALQPVIWDPRIADGQGNITNKLFFNKPASDLPTSASIRYKGGALTSTWLKNTPITPTLSNFRAVGRESGVLSNTVGPQGAIISFTSNVNGTYRILIDVNNNGSYEDNVDVIIIGNCEANVVTQVVWDGKNGLGNPVTKNSTITIRGAVSISEIHFPYSDVESNLSGVIIHQLDNNYNAIPGKDIVYWNDANITGVSIGVPNPISNHIEGRSSSTNGHIWGSNLAANAAETNQFGNNKTLDTWTFLESVPALITSLVDKFTVDVAVNYVTPDKNAVSMCGDSITYTIEVENKTSSAATDPAYGAKFEFSYPAGLIITNVSYAPTVGTSNVIANTNITTDTKYSTFMNLASGAKGIFTIKAKTNTLLYEQTELNVRGAIIRPADYEDIDATDNTTTTGPIDALTECNGLPSGLGCNNIVYNNSVSTIFCSTAGIEKTSNLNGLFSKGDTITYTVKYVNTDPYAHLGVNISDTLPSGVTLVPGSIQVTTTTPYNATLRTAYTSAGNHNFTVPTGVSSITIDAWGGGGGGANRTSVTNQGGGGGGGGAYSNITRAVTAGQIYVATVGAGGNAAIAGNDSYLRLNGNATNIVLAKGGSTPTANTANSAAGGLASAGVGNIRYNGGTGAAGNNPTNTAGGGGASATASGAGVNAIGQFGAVANTSGGNGGRGAGASATETPVNGSFPGGGGGGGFIVNAANNKSAGSGATGQIIIRYVSNNNPGTVGTFPNVASNWSVNANEEVIVTYKVVVNNNFNGDSIKNVARTTSTYVTTPIYDTVVDYRKINLTGNIFNDSNGLKDNTVNGAGTNQAGTQTLYVHLLDADNKIIAVTPAGANGAYTFSNINTGNYQIAISSVQGNIGQNITSSTLPSEWVNTGEHIGTSAGHDGLVNGITPVVVTNRDITDINFGINVRPVPDTITLATQYNPGGNNTYTVPNTSFSGSDANGHIDSIKITSFPTNTITITINGVTYTSSNFPAGGVKIPTNSSGNPTVSISIDPIDGNITSSIPYVVIDNAGFESTNTGYVRIPFVYNTTNAVNDENSTWINTPVSGDVTTNDFDLEGNTQTFGSFLNQNGSGNTIASGSTVSGTNAQGNPVTNAGTLTFNANGTYTYTPAHNFVGNISVPYSICDNGNPAACDTAYLDITVSPLANIANSVIANNDEYVSFGQPVNSNVFVNDKDPQGDNFSVTGIAQGNTTIPVGTPTVVTGIDENGHPVANAGTLTQNANGTMTFVPAPGFVGQITYNYTITDNGTPVASDNATVVISVVRDQNGPLNDPPFAGDDFSYTTVNTPVNGNFTGNDSDPNNDPISIKNGSGNPVTIVPGGPKTSVVTKTTQEGGTVEFFSDGTYTYTPPTGYIGPDRVIYEICDITVIQPQPLCAQATIHLLVGTKNTTNAVNDENSTWINTPVSGDVTTNDFDREGNTQTFGSFLNQNGSGNPISSGSTVAGTDANGNPVANAGTLTFNTDGTYTYTPANGFTGNISVPYAICDNGHPQACDTAVLDITVSPLPNITNSVIANNDEYFSYGSPVNANVFVNDADPQGNNFTVTGVKQGATTIPVGNATTVSGIDEKGNIVANAGTLTQNANGTMNFLPAPGFTGTVTYQYTITDDGTPVAKDDATVVISVVRDHNGPLNDPPFAGDDFSYTTINTPVNGNFSGNDSDPNNDPISIKNGSGNPVTIVPGGPKTSVVTKTTEEGGTVEFFSDGTYTYTPPTGYIGPDRVIYEICDVTVILPQPLCAEATIHLLVGTGYSIAGNVYNDANGMKDNIVNASNGSTNAGNKLYAVLTDTNGNVLQSVPVDADGTYEFINVPGAVSLQVLLDTISRTKDEVTTTSALPSGWVSTGERNGTTQGHDGNINGISAVIPALTADVNNVNFGIQRIPVADAKLYNVANVAFEKKDFNDPLYPNEPGFETFFIITTASSHLTGNGLGGSLTGTDAEDCPNALDCNTGKRFLFGAALPSTVVYYNYGGETGIRRLQEGDFIPDYNPAYLVIAAREGSGMSDDPIGFTYALVDNAGFPSIPVTYTILTESALPVELLYFSATSSQCNVSLNWATASELNNDYFEVQKSKDAMNWTAIGKIAGNGTSNFRNNYSFDDVSSSNGTTYYRLKQVDFDGTAEYHKTIAVENIKCFNNPVVRIFPNPTSRVLHVEVQGLIEKEQPYIYLTDALGRDVKVVKQTENLMQIDVSDLATGNYYIRILKNHQIITVEKIIILK